MAKTLIKVPKEAKLTLSLFNNQVDLSSLLHTGHVNKILEDLDNSIMEIIEVDGFNLLDKMGNTESFQKYPVVITFQSPLLPSQKDNIVSACKFQKNSEEFRLHLEDLINQYKDSLPIDEIKDMIDFQVSNLKQ